MLFIGTGSRCSAGDGGRWSAGRSPYEAQSQKLQGDVNEKGEQIKVAAGKGKMLSQGSEW